MQIPIEEIQLTKKKTDTSSNHKLSLQIIYGMLAGIIVGLALKQINDQQWINNFVIEGVIKIGGSLFIALMRMLVVPIVFFSIVAGTASLGNTVALGRTGSKTLALYLCTTAIATSLGLLLALMFNIGSGATPETVTERFIPKPAPSLSEVIINIVPTNPVQALAEANMLQIIFFAILLGSVFNKSKQASKHLKQIFQDLNDVFMELIHLVLKVAPLGVFCLITKLIATFGFQLIIHLIEYFVIVLLALLIHVIISNSLLLRLIAGINPIYFFKKIYPAQVFAFSTASSNASIPIVLDTVESELGVNKAIAAFIVPLGATINMDGTAIMQGVATVFIANIYGIHIPLLGYLSVIMMATLASIGTAGVPGVGLITLAMVLEQHGLPVSGIAIIIGIDRLLDMARTAVNITGDATIACCVAKSENLLDLKRYAS